MNNKKYLLIILIILLLITVGLIYFVIVKEAKTPPSISSQKETPTPLPIQNKITCQSTDMECIINNLVNNFKKGCTPIELTVNPEEGSQVNPIIVSIYGFINNKCYYLTRGLNPDLNCSFKKDYVTETTIKGLLGMSGIPDTPEFQRIKKESCK